MTKNLSEITQKMRAKVLWDAGFRSPSSMYRYGKIPQRSAERYIREFSMGGDHNRKAYSPRNKPKKTKGIVKKVVKKASKRDKIYTLRQIGRHAGVSHEQARKILRERQFRYSRYKKRVVINDKTRHQRLEFAQNMLNNESDFGYIIYSDECSFWLNNCRSDKVWTQDKMEEEGGGIHGPKIHVWGAISSRGAVSLKIFENNLNGRAYREIIKSRVQEMHRLFPEGFIFQQDGSSIHRADDVKAYLNRVMPQTLMHPVWPRNSPDLNPIENIWGWLKNQVNREMPKTVNTLKSCIRKHWRTLNEDFLAPYFESTPDRMRMVIENEGGVIDY